MRTTHVLVLLGTLALCAAAGFALATQDTPVELPGSGHAAPAPAGPEAAPAAAPAAGTLPPRDQAQPVEAAFRKDPERVDTRGWTSGTIRGDIQLAVSVLDRLQSISVSVEEARRPIGDDNVFRNPWRTIVPVALGVGTPRFEITGVPFSDCPYVVAVHAPGLNGTRRTLTIDAANPLVEDVVLTITPGAPFSVLLRDQDAGPYPGIEVQLVPVGDPPGRRGGVKTSDNYGSAVFEDVLAGDYEVRTLMSGQPLGDAQRVTIQPSYTGGAAGAQGFTLTIPRGMALEVRCSDVVGYGVADVQVTATASDRIKLTVVEQTTDFGGNARFPHLTPGTWQIDVVKDGFQRSHRIVTVNPDQPTTPQEFRLVRLR